MMKKRNAILLMAAMITGIMTASAFAQEPDATSGATQIGGTQMPGGNENGQGCRKCCPQMPGGNANGQGPRMNDQQAPQMNNHQAPQNQTQRDNGQQAPQGQTQRDNSQQAPQGQTQREKNQQTPQGNAPMGNGQQAPNGQAPKGSHHQNSQNSGEAGQGSSQTSKRDGNGMKEGFSALSDSVKDGTISQETYDAIVKYMEENKPDLLKELLNANVITQEEYDALVAKRDASGQATSSDTQESSDNQKTDNTENQTGDTAVQKTDVNGDA